jgi:DNA repair exonuclease SbcCD ATPase subunit
MRRTTMTPKDDVLDESTMIITEIESNLEKALQKRKEEIEREYQDRIRREKEESDKKLTMIQQEFDKEKETLKDYRGAISEFETVRDTLQVQIDDLLEKAIGYQKEIEKLAALTLEELKAVGELSSKLTELRRSTEVKVTELRTKLKEKYGIVTEGLEEKSSNEIVVDLEQELNKLKKIKELLEAEPDAPKGSHGQNPHPAAQAEPAALPEEPDPPQGQPEFRMPEINQFIEDLSRQADEAKNPGSFQEHSKHKNDDKPIFFEELNFQAVFEALERYRKAEATDYNGEISFFQNQDRMILDGESLIRAVTHMLEDAKKMYQKLEQVDAAKDQFFIKQELINSQEVLRKVILRSVKMCEKDNCSLPKHTADILNVLVLKDILEKLNMDNWSNEEDFNAFESFATKLKDTFYKKITPPALYLKSIVDELEG